MFSLHLYYRTASVNLMCGWWLLSVSKYPEAKQQKSDMRFLITGLNLENHVEPINILLKYWIKQIVIVQNSKLNFCVYRSSSISLLSWFCMLSWMALWSCACHGREAQLWQHKNTAIIANYFWKGSCYWLVDTLYLLKEHSLTNKNCAHTNAVDNHPTLILLVWKSWSKIYRSKRQSWRGFKKL